MPNFLKRSSQPEYLDNPNVPFEDIRQNMRELEFINSHLGGHVITLEGILSLMGNRKKIHICEIGCGGGDNLKVIEARCLEIGVDASFTGIDINEFCIRYAKENTKTIRHVDFICADFRDARLLQKPDIVFSSLFCHHFSDEDVKEIIEWKNEYSKLGFFINDLHRHPMAYHSIRTLTRVFSKSYLVKNDAPLSVEKGFTRPDWQRLFDEVKIHGLRPIIQWKWAFRWLVTVSKDVIPINRTLSTATTTVITNINRE